MSDETYGHEDVAKAFDRFAEAHPAHATTICAMMWMGHDRVHHFKHRQSRKTVTFDESTGEVTGELETGETSTDVDAVMREAATI